MTRLPIAVITGAASGIGAATARRLAGDRYRVWLADLRADEAEGVAEGIRLSGADAHAIQIDVGDRTSIQTAFATITNDDPAIDVLVNSAGVIGVCRFDGATPEIWERTYRINVIGAYLCIQAALGALRAAPPPARVVNLASSAGKMAGPFNAPYHASKAAVISLTRSAAAALAPDIIVNCVCPGVIDTPMWRDLDADLVKTGAGPGIRFQDRVASLPIKRAGTAEEVASVIAFLVSPEGRYILGEDVNVNGGLLMY